MRCSAPTFVNDMTHRPYPKTRLPVHEIALVAMGLRLIDNAHLERLAEACAERSRWEFCFTGTAWWWTWNSLLAMVERSTTGRATLGADRGYDTRDFAQCARAG